MSLLVDRKLFDATAVEGGIQVTNLERGDWESKDSAIQPSSLDLTIGEIHLPPTRPRRSWRTEPKTGYSLLQGETAYITTKEKITLSAKYAALGFPPNRVSEQGLLMTNPGHIDPGYDGTLNFTVINMGHKPFELRHGDKIVTLLIFELDSEPTSDYDKRKRGVNASETSDEGSTSDPISETVRKLSRDFLNVKERAIRAANEEVDRAARRLQIRQIAVPIVVAIVTAFGANFLTLQNKADVSEISRLETRIITVESKLNFEENLESIKQQLLDELRGEIRVREKIGVREEIRGGNGQGAERIND